MEEKGVGYDLVEVDFLQGSAIGRYVDEVFDGPSLQPDDARERARMTQIISILDSYTYPCTVGQLVIQRLVMPMLGNQPDEAAIAAALPEIGKCMNVLAALCADNAFLVGDQVTLADLHFVPIYDYFQNTPESDSILEQNPGLRAWWDGVSKRESVQKTRPPSG
jgi:glutathione S-transferase